MPGGSACQSLDRHLLQKTVCHIIAKTVSPYCKNGVSPYRKNGVSHYEICMRTHVHRVRELFPPFVLVLPLPCRHPASSFQTHPYISNVFHPPASAPTLSHAPLQPLARLVLDILPPVLVPISSRVSGAATCIRLLIGSQVQTAEEEEEEFPLESPLVTVAHGAADATQRKPALSAPATHREPPMPHIPGSGQFPGGLWEGHACPRRRHCPLRGGLFQP